MELKDNGEEMPSDWQSLEQFAGHLLWVQMLGHSRGCLGSLFGCLEGARWDQWLQGSGGGAVEETVGTDTGVWVLSPTSIFREYH